jgi:HK97 family phage portal protein
MQAFIDHMGARGSYRTDSGLRVSPETAMRIATVHACVKILTESISQLTLSMFRRVAPRQVQPAPEHHLDTLLRHSPNAEDTPFDLKEMVVACMALRGLAYVQVVRDRRGWPIELVYLRFDRMRDRRSLSGELYFEYRRDDGTTRQFSVWDLWRPRYFLGLSPIRLAAEQIGTAIATDKHASTFFRQGARPGGVLSTERRLQPKARKNLTSSWHDAHGGPENLHQIALLEEGIKYTSIGLSAEDAQLLETRRFNVQEICRIYRVPPHMVAELSRSSFNNIEHQGMSFVTQTLGPWMKRIEESITRDLIPPEERQEYFAAFNPDELTRGDIKARYEAWSKGRLGGWLNVNEIRGFENLNPIGPAGDIYLDPLNMAPAGGGEDKPDAPPSGDPDNSKGQELAA